jgi:hypothetical protein
MINLEIDFCNAIPYRFDYTLAHTILRTIHALASNLKLITMSLSEKKKKKKKPNFAQREGDFWLNLSVAEQVQTKNNPQIEFYKTKVQLFSNSKPLFLS